MLGYLLLLGGGGVFDLGIFWAAGRSAAAICGGVLLLLLSVLWADKEVGVRGKVSSAIESTGDAIHWIGERLHRDAA